MVSLVQVSQYTVISAWNSMITPAVKWFVNGDIMTTNKLPSMYYYVFLITVISPIQNQYKSYLIKKLHALFFLFCFILLLFKHKKKGVIKLIFCMKLKSKYINYNIRFLKLLLYDLNWSNNDIKSVTNLFFNSVLFYLFFVC
jgi:hypothetical protein